MFRVIIAGTRHFNDYGLLREYADKLLENKRAAGEKIIILSGHCYGADLLGERYARERGYPVEVYEAQCSDGFSRPPSAGFFHTLTTQSPFAIISRRRTAMLF